MSINRVNQYPISQLFDTESKLIFEIPKYQREYTWGAGQWENLFDDLSDNDSGYFLGTIICIDTTADSINAPKREVVDGQQRLTTLSLLLAALYSTLYEHRSHMNDDQQSDILQLKRKLVLRNTDAQIRVVPQVQNHNLDDYKGVLAEQKIIPTCPLPKFAGVRRIKKAFEYFKKRIAKTVTEKIESVEARITNGQAIDKSAEALISLFEILEKVNSAVMVMIEVSSHSDAYTLFESLNNRGTPLTAVDLIKNLLLARLDVADGTNLDDYFQQWQRIIEYLGDDYAVQERFFRHNYNAFRKSLNAPFSRPDDTKQYALGLLATRSTMLDIYERIIKRDPKEFLEALIDNAKIYSAIILQNTEGLNPALQEGYENLSRVQGAPSYLLLLYLVKEKTSLAITDIDIKKVVDLLVSFFVRRNLTDTPPTRDLTRIFMSLIEDIESSGYTENAVYNAIRNKLLSNSASDAAFEEKLRGPVYNDNYDATRFILCMIAKQGMTVESTVDLWKTNNNLHVWTVEHIFPQGETIPDNWVTMIANGDVAKAREYQAQYVHTFGNLTITGYNATLSNRSFEDKRDRKDNSGREIGYRNGLNLNADVVAEQEWTINRITERTERLVTTIKDLFKM